MLWCIGSYLHRILDRVLCSVIKSIKRTYEKATVIRIFRSSSIYPSTRPGSVVTLVLYSYWYISGLMSMLSWLSSSGVSRRTRSSKSRSGSTASASPFELVTHAHSPTSPNLPLSFRLRARRATISSGRRRFASLTLTDSKCARVPIGTNGSPSSPAHGAINLLLHHHHHTVTCTRK